MKAKLGAEAARDLILSIPHKTCVNAIDDHWIVTPDGTIRAQSVLWLFCWAKTGMNSENAREAAVRAFNEIMPIDFGRFETIVDHQYARENRYTPRDIEGGLKALLVKCALADIDIEGRCDGKQQRTFTQETSIHGETSGCGR